MATKFVAVKVQIRGIRPLLCHNAAQLADPISELSKQMKELTAVRSKTEEHHRAIARLEWVGGLYLDEKRRPVVPDTNLEACIVAGAKKSKLGDKFKAGMLVL